MEKYCSRRSYVRSTAASPGRYNEMGSNQQCEPSTNLSSGSMMHLRSWYGICLINQTVENVYMYTVEHMYVIISWSSKYNKISSYKEVVLQRVQSLIQILLWFKCVRDHTVILSLDCTISPEGGIKIQKIINPVETWKNSHPELYTDFLRTGLYFLLFDCQAIKAILFTGICDVKLKMARLC